MMCWCSPEIRTPICAKPECKVIAAAIEWHGAGKFWTGFNEALVSGKPGPEREAALRRSGNAEATLKMAVDRLLEERKSTVVLSGEQNG